MLADDAGNRKLLAANGGSYAWPSVCGQGEKIVYSAFHGDKRNVWRMDSDGSNAVQFTEEGLASRPQCSPDGTWVLYANSDTAWRQPLAGGTPVRVAENLSSRATAISADGKFVAYIAMPGAPSGPNLLTIIPSQGGAPVRTFELPLGADELHWVWSRAPARSITCLRAAALRTCGGSNWRAVPRGK